jgi:hypothetical protein
MGLSFYLGHGLSFCSFLFALFGLSFCSFLFALFGLSLSLSYLFSHPPPYSFLEAMGFGAGRELTREELSNKVFKMVESRGEFQELHQATIFFDYASTDALEAEVAAGLVPGFSRGELHDLICDTLHPVGSMHARRLPSRPGSQEDHNRLCSQSSDQGNATPGQRRSVSGRTPAAQAARRSLAASRMAFQEGAGGVEVDAVPHSNYALYCSHIRLISFSLFQTTRWGGWWPQRGPSKQRLQM